MFSTTVACAVVRQVCPTAGEASLEEYLLQDIGQALASGDYATAAAKPSCDVGLGAARQAYAEEALDALQIMARQSDVR